MDSIINFIVTYWIGIVFGVLTSIITYFYKSLMGYKKTIETIRRGVRSLLKGEIIRKYYEYKEKGMITIYEKQLVEELYTEYSNLGGNDVIKELYDALREIPVSDK